MPARRISPSTVEPLTIEQAKLHLRVDYSDDDELITELIKVARATAEDRIGRTLISTGWRLTANKFSPALELPNPPCISVESIKYIDTTGTEQPLNLADYLVDQVSEPARIVPTAGRDWPETQDRINAVVVDYTAGYGTTADKVPTPIVQWMKLAIGDMYDRRNRSAEKPNVPQDFADSLLDVYRMWGV